MAVVQSEGQVVAAHRPGTSIARGITLYDGAMSSYAELYRAQPNVRLVNGFLARNIAQLGLHAFEAVSDEERRRLERSHPLARLLRRPNPYVTRYAFVNALVHDLGIYDVWVALKLRNRQTGELRLFRLPPYMVEPAGDSWLFADGYILKGSKEKVEIERDQVVVIHGYNPSDSRTGLSPLESLRRVLAEEAAAGEWREQYWRGAARISGVIERPKEAPQWSDTARNRFRSDWQATYAGSGALAGATPILEEGMIWKAASFSPKDSEYLGARRLSREETAAAYFVSPLFVGLLEHANFSNVKEQHKHLYQDTLGPRLVEIEEAFEMQLLPEFDVVEDTTYFEFNIAEKLKGSFEEEAQAMQTAVGAPWMTRNEARSRKNLPPVAGGDDLVTPLNVLVGGQASPRDGGSGQASRPPATTTGRKALPELPAGRQGWQEKHAEVVTAFFERQGEDVTAALRSGSSLDEAFDADRWNGELGAELYALAVTMSSEVGAGAAETFGGAYDENLTFDYHLENTRIAAEKVNETTRAELADALEQRGAASRSKAAGEEDEDDDEDDDPFASVVDVFAAAVAVRAGQIALTRATAVESFARHEAAHQSGVPMKVWRVNSARPRAGHPGNGETVGIDEVFSNGARWPGDASAGVDQTAGCTCSLEFEVAS
jgi:HK97 family phage portal protein